MSARYAADNITPGEIESVIRKLTAYSSADLYVLCRYPQYYAATKLVQNILQAHADRSERRRSESNRRRQRRNVLWCHRLRQKLYDAFPDAVADEKRFEKVQPERRGAQSRNEKRPFSKDCSHSISILTYAINRCRTTR